MFDIVVDVDGVLLDIHEQMKIMLGEEGISYDVNNVYTYDFNKGLPNIPKFNNLPSRDMIYELFGNPELYQDAPVDWDSISIIRHYASQGVRFLIYTMSANSQVFMTKQALFSKWFSFSSNIAFKSVVNQDNNCKKGLSTKVIIEDSHVNLREYGSNTLKYLVDRPYNQLTYNYEYEDVFSDKNFFRFPSAYGAINDAVYRIKSLK